MENILLNGTAPFDLSGGLQLAGNNISSGSGFLNNNPEPGAALIAGTMSSGFGNSSSAVSYEDQYLVGDWDGDGKDNFAVRRGNQVWMDFNFDGLHDLIQSYGNGNSEDQYLVGDWDGDGKDNLAVRRGNQVLMDFNFDGLADQVQYYGNGNSEDQYLVGDWNGDGRDNLAVRRGNQVWMDFNFDGLHDLIQSYGNGNSEDQYLVGDWNGDGRDNLAVRRGNQVWMDFNFDGLHDLIQSYGNGNSEDQYLAGDWNGDGRDNLAVRRGNQVLMDFNFDGLADRLQSYGNGTPERDPGNTLSTAEFQNSAIFSRNQQVNASDTNDFYRFTVNQSGIFTTNLTGLTGDADVRLIQDSNNNGVIDQGEVLAWQWERGTGDESIRRFLNSGNYFMQVMSYNNQTADYSLSTNFTAAASDNRQFSMEVNFVKSAEKLTDAMKQAVRNAAEFWESVIPYSSFNGNHTLTVTVGGSKQPWDSDRHVLASANYRNGARDANGRWMPTTGVANVNTDPKAISALTSDINYFTQVMIHEFGHVLGIGSLWEDNGRNFVRRADGTYNSNTYAGWAYGELNGTFTQTAIPLTTGVGAGSDYSHWREQVFADEIMTHAISPSGSPLSQMTIASLRDIGWNVNYGASEPYSLRNDVVRATINQVQTIDNPDGSGGDADFYARVNIAGVEQRSDDVGDRNDIRPNWQFSQGTSSASVPITISIFDADDWLRGDDDHVDINPLQGQRDLHLTYDLNTGLISSTDGSGVSGRLGELITVRGAGDSDRALLQFTIDQFLV